MNIAQFISFSCAIVLILVIIFLFRRKTQTVKTVDIETKIIKHTYAGYEVLEILNVLSPQECKDIISYSKAKGMNTSDVLSPTSSSGTEVNNQYRDSMTAWLSDDEHPLVMKLAKISEKLTGLPRENQEMIQVAFYQPNGKFNEHFDACVYDDVEYCAKMNNNAGQRRATLLLYLNDDFQGGETEFVSIGLKVKPETGKAILFWNTDENEKILESSKHKGNPVANGEKWICTKWSHVRRYT